MTADRGQIRRDAEALIAANPDEPVEDFGYDELRFAHACLALLAELKQTERQIEDEKRSWRRQHADAKAMYERAEQAERALNQIAEILLRHESNGGGLLSQGVTP